MKPGAHGGQRALTVGLAIMALSVLMALMPLMWGRSGINKYLVGLGFFGICLGISFALHGAWDCWRGR